MKCEGGVCPELPSNEEPEDPPAEVILDCSGGDCLADNCQGDDCWVNSAPNCSTDDCFDPACIGGGC